MTPPLFKVLDPTIDSSGVEWFPVAAWAREDGTYGYPWQLETTLALGAYGTRNAWEYLALTCHLVTGVEDRYEHTFDSWERKEGDEDRHSFVEIMVPVGYQVEAAAKALATDVELADQFLLYRTLHSRLPGPLLEWFAVHDAGARDAASEWGAFASGAAASVEREYAGTFEPEARRVPLCEVTPELEVRLHSTGSPAQHPPMARLLDYALTANLLRWHELFTEVAPGLLTLRSGATATLRAAMDTEDPTCRIGTLDGGRNSDSALRLLLQARLMNLVAPVTLWARLGVWSGGAPEGEWRLPLPETMRLGWVAPLVPEP